LTVTNIIRVTGETGEARRVVLIRELSGRNELLRGEGYLYDGEGRRSHRVDELGRVTEYRYDVQSRVAEVIYPWTAGKAGRDRKEAEEAGLHFAAGAGEFSGVQPIGMAGKV
jgi:YD repeat-containing protein